MTIGGGELKSGSREFRVPWSQVGAVGAIFGVGSLGALVIVASVKDVDTLSTVALALAVLAFVIQILLFVAQTAVAGQQQRDIQQINAETKSLLVELRTHAVDTNQIVGEQFNKLLDRFVLEAKNASGAGDPAFDLDSFRQNFLMDVAAMVDEARRASGQVGQIRSRETSEERERARRLERARRGPSERILGALMSEPMLAELSEPLVRTLSQYAFDVVISNETHIPEGLVVRPDQDGIRELTHLGLIELGDPPWPRGEEEEVWGHLTPKGRALASLITAESVPPDAEKHFPWLRLARDVLDPRRTE